MKLAYNFYRQEHYEDPETKLDRLHSIGVREAVLVFGFRPKKHNILHPVSPGGTSATTPSNYIDWSKDIDKMKAVANKAKDLGWEVSIKPHFHSQDLVDLGGLKWWSGFCIFEDNQKFFFESFMNAFFIAVIKEFNPDRICIENEMMQMLYEDQMWGRIINRIPKGIKLTVALNFFQPFKMHWIWRNTFINRFLITKRNIRSYISRFGFNPVIVSGVEWKYFKAGKPLWIDRLDDIGFNAYWFPTFNNTKASVTSIKNTYHNFILKHRIWFWTLVIKTNYPQLLQQYAARKDWRVTEIDVISGPVKQDWEAYKKWWQATIEVFESSRCNTLTVWDDRSWGWWVKMMEEKQTLQTR